MRSLRCPLLMLALLSGFSGSLWAQTTGRLIGQIKDESGGPLPGATVEVRSPALQGTRSAVSGPDGVYRLTLLPPGRYEVSVSLQSFATETRKDVTVSLDKDTALDATLRLQSVQAEITVVGEVPAVDTTTTDLGTNLTTQAIQTLPTGRNYSSVVQVTPGVSSDANPDNRSQNTITVYGSSGAENAFLIDGVNTTNVEYGFQGKELNFEFIEELDVKTGGYEAEYGRSTGAIVNVITKSGSNEFHGDVFGYTDEDSLQRTSETTVSTGGIVSGFRRRDYGADVGGYILKDRLWFFGAFDRVANTTNSQVVGGPPNGIQSDSDRDLASAKLTLLLSQSQNIVASFFQDPRKDTGAINDNNHTLNGDALTYEGRQDFGGRDFALRYDGVFGSEWIASAQLARHNEDNSVGPATSAGDVIQYRNQANNFFQTGGFGLIQEKSFSRTFGGASVSRFLGRHELKLGVEYENEQADVIKRMSGGQQVDVTANPNLDSNEPFIYRHFYWTTPDATVQNAPVSQLEASPEHKITTLYLQDRWNVLDNLTLNFGLRWDRQQIVDASGVTQVDLNKDFAPRFGFVFDPTGDHRTKIYGSYGHFYEQLPMDLVIRSFSYERQPRIINFDQRSVTPDPRAEDDLCINPDLCTHSAILGGFTEPSDPDIKGQYLREFILGAEREVFPDITVGIKGIYRDYRRVIEDFLCMDDGTYCIGNPGEGIMKRVFTLDYSQQFDAPKPERVFKGIQIDVQKRFSKNWQGLASYVLSKLDGNYDGEYSPFTNVGADPNISAAYDYYDFFTNGRDLNTITNKGDLSNDRRHQFKVSGVYFTPFKLSLGLSAYYRTGTPVTRYGYSDAYGRYEFFLTPRGGEGRSPSTYEADLHLGYPLEVGPVTVNFLLDIFNVLNAQRAVLLDQRYSFTEACNFQDTCTAPTFPENQGYLKPVLRTPPTSLRLGMRVSF
jgi:carboxypeptidase family protein/TonB-dependent receptor-like protein